MREFATRPGRAEIEMPVVKVADTFFATTSKNIACQSCWASRECVGNDSGTAI